MRVTVDGHEAEVPSGSTLLDASRAAGVDVPTLCWDPRTSPGGSCRVCLVALDGHPVPACSTPAHEGASVFTRDERARGAARTTLELLLSELPPRALEAPAERSELVRVCTALGVDSPGRLGGARHERGRDHSHPYLKLDRDLCIACGRCVRICDEVQGQFALTLVGRGFETHVAPGAASWVESDCVSCGTCADACPTGAISEPGLLDLLPAERTTTTTCGYCGVGCTLEVHTRRDEVVSIGPALDGPVNRGHACVKGRFAHGFARARDRLTEPLVRTDGELRPATWDQAIARVGSELRRIRDEHGPDAIGLISSARATNEENYLAQKLMRAVIGTHNVDNCSRLCHSPSAAGLVATFGLSGGTNRLDDLDGMDCVLLSGSNPTEAHPVVGARLKQLALAGARLVVVDPRRTELAALADVHLQLNPGTNVALFNAMAHVLLEEGLADEAFLAARAEGLDELRLLAAEHPPERVADIVGMPPETIRRAARLYGRARRRSIVYGLGMTEQLHGTDGVRALANLAVLTGGVGVPGQGGVNPLRGQNNVQGASDVGALPDLLPGYQRVDDDAAACRFEQAWGASMSRERGLRINEMFDAAIAGDLRALIVVGEDVLQTDPNSSHVKEALESRELLVCHELFLSRTAEHADVVLPAASFLEKDGTFVNFDRRFQRVRPAIAAPGQARSDFEILHLLAGALGADLGCPAPADALAERASLAPLFAGISHERLDHEGALHWPCRSPEDPGEGTLYLERFATPSGRARLAAVPYLPPGESPDDEFPFLLVTGRRLEHYNAGTMTRRTPNLDLLPRERVEVHPDDAESLGLRTGDRVEVASRRGVLVAPVNVSDSVARGQLFMAFHFPGVPANVLTSDASDVVTACPEYKVTAVRMRKAGLRSGRPGASGRVDWPGGGAGHR